MPRSSAKKRRTEFGNKFFARVVGRAESRGTKSTWATIVRARPMDQLVTQDGVKRTGVLEPMQVRHVNPIFKGAVIGTVAALADFRARVAKEQLGPFAGGIFVPHRNCCRRRLEFFRQAVCLFGH